MERRFAFNAIADQYNAVRPTYPRSLTDDVVREAGLKAGQRILELGCGTGHATQGFAETGLDILALDPGAQMIETARRNLNARANVTFAVSTFEEWPLEAEAFSLVFSAQAWHWIDPEIRFAKAAAALAPSGTLAVFGNTEIYARISEPLGSELVRVYQRHAPQFLNASGADWYLSTGPIEALFAQSGLYAPVIHKTYSWRAEHTGQSYAALMSTFSSHRLLPENVRNALLDDIVATVHAAGGHVELPYETHLYMAHKA